MNAPALQETVLPVHVMADHLARPSLVTAQIAVTVKNDIVTGANRVLTFLDQCATEWFKWVDGVLCVTEKRCVVYSFSRGHDVTDIRRPGRAHEKIL